jgi:H+/Cl- antiporter ClcA
MAVAALVLGILGLVTSFTVVGGIIFGLLGIIFGIIASRRAKRGEAGGRGMAIAGIVTGALGVLVVIALIAVGASLLNSNAGKTYRDCVNNANGDPAALQACANQFNQQLNNP